MRLRDCLDWTSLRVCWLLDVGLLGHGGLKRRMREIVGGHRMRGERCILGCRHRVLSHGLSIDWTQAVTALVASRAATFRHNEMKKEENETARLKGDASETSTRRRKEPIGAVQGKGRLRSEKREEGTGGRDTDLGRGLLSKPGRCLL